MIRRAAHLTIGAAICCAALSFGATSAQAWTYQDCVEVNFEHPDCTQYTTTTTTTQEATSSTTTVPPTSTTAATATTSTTVTTGTTSSNTSPASTPPQMRCDSNAPNVTNIECSSISTPMTPSTTGSETLAANTANNELPMTGGVALWPFGLFAVAFGAVAIASTRRHHNQ